MNTDKTNKTNIEQAGDDLFNFAVDREDVKLLLTHLSGDSTVKPTTVEYELQILKIIGVGWSISYFLEHSPLKMDLAEAYWQRVHEFSGSLSETTGLMIGQNIDYFQILKDRLDTYITAMEAQPDAPEPAVVVGPEFARTCGDVNDVFSVMTGSRMFIAAMGAVKEYLETIKLR